MKRWLALIVLAACSTENLASDVCGNGVVEQGEDCDDPDNTACVACGITCTPGHTADDIAKADQGCAELGNSAGFVCGADGFCHAPSGVFEQVARFSMPADELVVTDVDGDGIGEVVVQSQSSITTVFGAGGSSGLSTASVQTPIAVGATSFGHVDGDLSIDTLIPTADGIAELTSAFGAPAPFPFSQPAGGDANGKFKPVMVRPIKFGQLGVLAINTMNDHVVYFVLDTTLFNVDMTGPLQVSTEIDVCNAISADLVLSDVDAFVPPPAGPEGHQMLALTLHTATGEQACTVIANEDGTPFNPHYSATSAKLLITPKSRPVLGLLQNTTSCPSLVFAQNGQVVEFKPIGTGFPGCAFAVTGTPFKQNVGDTLDGSTPIGVVPLAPAIQNAAPNALVTTSGVFAVFPGGAETATFAMYAADRTLDAVRATDIDKDGDIDLVASSANSENLDVLERREVDIQGTLVPFFVDRRFDTSGPVVTFELGDFDGNGFPDIAYVERASAKSERLDVAYGTSDGLLAGAIVGAVHEAAALIPTSFTDSGDRFGVIDDLVFIFLNDTGDLVLALLHGSTRRTMISYFEPRSQAPGVPPAGLIRGTVIGSFSGGTSNDILAVVDVPPPNQTSNGEMPKTRLFMSSGAQDGALTNSTANMTPPIDPDFNVVVQLASVCTDLPDGALCLDSAHYVGVPIGGTEKVIAIDRAMSAIVIDPGPIIAGDSLTSVPIPIDVAAEPNTVITGLQRISVDDGDPAVRILVTTGPDGTVPDVVANDLGKVYVCTLDVPDATRLTTASLHCVDVGDVVTAAAATTGATHDQVCIDAAGARTIPAQRFSAPDVERELIVLCHDKTLIDGRTTSVYRVRLDGSEVVLVGRDHGESARADAIRIGDVSGDGIDDVVLLDRSAVVPFMTVFRQCNSRDLACGSLSLVNK